MPELPEVETVRNFLDSQIVGQKALKIKITNKRLRYDIPNDLNNRLSNVILTKIIRRGKYLIFLYRNKQYLLIHLGMTGYFRVSKKIENRLHDHIHFLFYDKTLVFNDVRKFGFFKVYSKNEFLKSSHLKNMGPEPLEEKFNLDYFKKNKNRETSIKNLLMNQKFVAGLGNIYCSEILFDAGIHPEKRIKALKERDMILDINYPPRGTYKTVGCPLKLSESPAQIERPPFLGEHSESVLDDLCGIDKEQFSELKKNGVV